MIRRPPRSKRGPDTTPARTHNQGRVGSSRHTHTSREGGWESANTHTIMGGSGGPPGTHIRSEGGGWGPAHTHHSSEGGAGPADPYKCVRSRRGQTGLRT